MTINIIRKRGSTIKTSPPVPCKAKPVTQVLSSGQWKDETCFILGGGPSMKNLDFNLLRRYKTIGINKSIIKYPTDIVYSMDHTFYDMIRNKENDPVLFEAWKNFKGVKVFLRDNHFQYDESVYVVESLPKCISLSLTNGIHGGNNCYDSKTEILTDSGYKNFENLLPTDRVATLNRQTNLVEYELPIAYYQSNYSGPMVYVDSRQINLCVTPNHTMYVNNGHETNRFSFIEADKMNLNNKLIGFNRQFMWNGIAKEYFVLPSVIRKRNCFQGNLKESKIEEIKSGEKKIKMEDWLLFFGLWLGDGCTYTYFNKKGNPVYGIGFCGSIKKEAYQVFDDVISKIGFNFKKYYNQKTGVWNYLYENKQLFLYLRQFGGSKDKFIPREILNLSSNQLSYLLKGLMLTDGDKREKYYTTSKQLAENVYELLYACGSAATLRKTERKNFFNPNKTCVCYTVSKVVQNRVCRLKTSFVSTIDYSGMIYCVTTKNGIIFVRRNGKSCWSGNSGLGALMLAVALGCKRIGLFGYDFCVDKNQTHWHDGYSNQRVESLERNLVNFRKCVEEWAEPLKQMGIQAVNLSNHSALQQYPQMSLENFLKI